jgi:hypothetical protein
MGPGTQERDAADVENAGIPQIATTGVIMSHPKVKAVSAIDDHTLIVEFDNSEKKR